MRINPDRLLSRLDALARIGGNADGSVTRLAFSRGDRAGRDYVASLLSAANTRICIDAAGNLMAFREGEFPELDIVIAGSHTDSVRSGGHFDGALGVLAAVEVLEVLQENKRRTRRTVAAASFVNEEGARFMPDMMGSLFVAGALSLESLLDATDTDGTRVGDAINDTGMAGPDDFRSLHVHAFLELHIEQGPVLESSAKQIGVVTGVQGLRWFELRFKGRANHAGTTPMDRRADAGMAAARVMLAVRELTTKQPSLRVTIGSVVVSPNVINVIPGEVRMTVDLRNPDATVLDRAERRLRDVAATAGAQEGVSVEVHLLADAPAVTFAPDLVESIAQAAVNEGYSIERLISGAGHDAQILSRQWPSAMIFVPSRDGVSHSPEEWTNPADCVAGAEVLLQSVLSLAG